MIRRIARLVNRRTARRLAGLVVLNVGDLIRVCALIAIPVVIAAYVDPVSAWKVDAPVWGIVVIAFALLGVERVGLTLYNFGDRLAPARPKQREPYTARQFVAGERVYARIEAGEPVDVEAELDKAYRAGAEDDRGHATA